MLLFARNKNFHFTPLLIRDEARLMIRIAHGSVTLFALGQTADFSTRDTKHSLAVKNSLCNSLIFWKLFTLFTFSTLKYLKTKTHPGNFILSHVSYTPFKWHNLKRKSSFQYFILYCIDLKKFLFLFLFHQSKSNK